MSSRDWLSLAEIARLWSAECGESAEDLERDLDAWFSEYVAREPSQQLVASGHNGDNTNRLMGMLGGRYLERHTLEAYCEERGRPKPRFWFSGRIEEPRRDTARQADSTVSQPEAGSSNAASPEAGGKSPSPDPVLDPDLKSFQTQIASMSERLKAPAFDYSSLETPSEARQTDPRSQPGQAGPSREQNELELIERAEAASAKAHQLKMQLEAAERRLKDLTGLAVADPHSSPARFQDSDPGSPEAPSHEIEASVPSERRASAGYRDPSLASQLLHQGARRKGRGRTKLVAGLAVPVAALALWGGLHVIQDASNAPIPPTSLASPAERLQKDSVSQAYEPGAGQLGIGGTDLEPPAAPWSARETKPTAAELTAARQRLEAAMASATAASGPSRKDLILAIEIARAQAVLYKQDLDAALERLAQSEAETETANARADILTKELIASRQRHLAAVEIADADDNWARRQLARDALAASDRAASLEQDLSAARRRIAGLKAQLGAARSETASLTKQLGQLRKEHAALLEIFRAQTHQGGR